MTNEYSRFRKTIFIDASSQQQIQDDLESAIQSEGPEFSNATWKDAVAYLSEQKDWILFVDNADELNHELKKYLPNSLHGSIIITTRDQYNKIHAPDCAIDVEKLKLVEALDLLHSVSGVSPRSNDSSIAIVNELGLLALAITQAAVYISHTQQIDTYLPAFYKHRDQLMQDGSITDGNYNGSVYTAFAMSFENLSPKSIEFLKICSFLHHSLVPRLLFEKSIKSRFQSPALAEKYPPWESTETIVSNLEDVLGSKWDDHEFKNLLDPIFRSSLMTANIDSHGQTFYNFHPLVQTYVRDLHMRDDQDLFALSAGQLLLIAVSDWKQGRVDLHWQLVPHISNLPTEVRQAHIMHSCTFAFVLLFRDPDLSDNCLEQWSKDQDMAGSTSWEMFEELDSAFRQQFLLEQLEEMQQKDWVLLEENQGPQHPDTIVAMQKLAGTLQDIGQLQRAEEIWKRAPVSPDLPAPKFPDTTPAAEGDWLSQTIRWAKRNYEEMTQEILGLRQKILGPQDPRTIEAMEGLASILRESGRLEEAEKLHRELFELLKRNRSLEDDLTTNVMGQLVSILMSRGQLEEATKVQREFVELWKEKRGPKHELTTTAMERVVSILRVREQLEEAEKLQQEVVELWKGSRGPRDHWTIRAMEQLVSILDDHDQLEEAAKIQREVVGLWRENRGPRDRLTASAIGKLAAILRRHHNQQEEAKKLQQGIIAPLKKSKGPQDDATDFVAIMRARGELERIEKVQREVPELREELLSTVSSMGRLVSVLKDRGQQEEAEKTQREIVEFMKGAPHSLQFYTIHSMNELVSILRDGGQLEEAEKFQREIVEVEKETQGPRHYNTVRAMEELAKILGMRGHLKEAEQIQNEIALLRKDARNLYDPSAVLTMYTDRESVTAVYQRCILGPADWVPITWQIRLWCALESGYRPRWMKNLMWMLWAITAARILAEVLNKMGALPSPPSRHRKARTLNVPVTGPNKMVPCMLLY
jgi:tetratricopeptide (TPR) repeat protein